MLKTQKSMQPTIMQRQGRRTGLLGNAVFISIGLIAGLWTATQMVAHLFAYQSALGMPLWGRVYAPWEYLVWLRAWGTHYAPLMRGAGSAGMLVSNLVLLALYARQLSHAADNACDYLHGSARWAEESDIRDAGLLCEDGVYVGGWEDSHGKTHYLRHNGSEHLLCIAPTRSGKGVCLVVPTLLSWTQSCVVTDLKGELVALTAGWRRQHANNATLIFEPASNSGSIHWNPMDEVRIGTGMPGGGDEYEMGDAQNLATLIVDPNGHGLKDHWQKTSQALLVGCILHLLYMRQRTGVEASLAAVDAMLADPRGTEILWENMKVAGHYADGSTHPAVGKSAQDMIDRPAEEKGSVLSTAKSYLALFRDPVVERNVRDSGFRIRDLMNHDKPVTLYIVTQPTDKERLKPLVRILINMICRLLAGKMIFEIEKNKSETRWGAFWRSIRFKNAPLAAGRRARNTYKHKLLMMLDEFPSLGKLGIIQESLAFLAGYGIRFYLICQDTTQVKGDEYGYGREEAISSNCHLQNAFQPNREETAEYLSKLTGTTTIVKEQITLSGNRFSFAQGQVSRVLQEVSRPLMTPDECLRMPPPVKDGDVLIKGGNMLIYVAGFPAIFGRQMPYFQDPVFCARSRIDPPLTSDVLIAPPPRVALERTVGATATEGVAKHEALTQEQAPEHDSGGADATEQD